MVDELEKALAEVELLKEEYYEDGMEVKVYDSGRKLFYKNGRRVKEEDPDGTVWDYTETKQKSSIGKEE